MRETSVSCLLHTPNRGPGLHPRHVPWPRMESGTLQQDAQPTEPHQSGPAPLLFTKFKEVLKLCLHDIKSSYCITLYYQSFPFFQGLHVQ